MPTVRVNGVELYHEIRGSGPPVLLIMGGTGDGGHFDTLADLLADEFTVVTYDRRGNGRSPVPTGWTTTSPKEQADDAAGLVDALAVGPTAVFGTSSGGSFALWTLTRHPAIVRGAVLHDPGVYALLDDFDAIRAVRRRDRRRPGARTRASRGRYCRLCHPAATSRWAAAGVGVWSRKRGGKGRTPVVLRQRGPRTPDPAHEHQQAALLGRATATRRQLRDRPQCPGSPGA